MSLSKQQSNEDNNRRSDSMIALPLNRWQKLLLRIDEIKRQKRQSFDERICDDLSEVILKYLSLKDALRLECVSKQFQRTVFVSQNSLDFYSIKISTESLKQLLKKIPNLKQIIGENSTFNSDGTNEVIFKNCDKLTDIHFASEELIEKQSPIIEEMSSYGYQLSQVVFNKLKKLKLCLFDGKDLDQLEIFIENNGKNTQTFRPRL